VPADAWYSSYVNDLVKAGVVDSTKTMYRPGDLVNRAEMAKFAFQVSISLKDKAGLLATVTSDGSGKFSYLLSTSSLEFGDYYVQAASKAARPRGFESLPLRRRK
jgi:hypothetical protein